MSITAQDILFEVARSAVKFKGRFQVEVEDE
jgi:hypothetical protein